MCSSWGSFLLTALVAWYWDDNILCSLTNFGPNCDCIRVWVMVSAAEPHCVKLLPAHAVPAAQGA